MPDQSNGGFQIAQRSRRILWFSTQPGLAKVSGNNRAPPYLMRDLHDLRAKHVATIHAFRQCWERLNRRC